MNAVSRTKRFWVQVALAAFSASAVASQASAQIGWAPDGEVCTAERTVSGVVTERKTCIRWKPVTQVCMKRQDCVTYRDECRVGYRSEQYLQCVPKTVYDTVTVDEGCWKMVWVPKPVQKVVARQTVEKQVATRQVPYRYTEKVPHVVSRLVPEYKTAYVPEQYQTVQHRPFTQTLPSQTTAMMPQTCAAPALSTAFSPTCAMPAEPGCAMPMMNQGTPMMHQGAPMMHQGAPTPTYAPQAVPNGGYEAAPETGPVPNPTPDPVSFYPTKPQPTPPGSATWSSTKPRTAGIGTHGSGLGGGAANLASLWTR